MRKIVTCFLLLVFSANMFGQNQATDTITRTATIIYDLNGNSISLQPETPVLSQIAGAPKAFYTYYWEFGDGAYSFQKDPKHTYKEKGDYRVQLSVTNNYDDGKPPQTRPKDITVSQINNDVSSNEKHHLLSAYDGFRLQTNRDPVPDEEMQFILSYGNDKAYPTNGRIYLFFNEVKYKADNFELTDVRLYNNEFESDDAPVVTYQENAPMYEKLYVTNQILKKKTEEDIVIDFNSSVNTLSNGSSLSAPSLSDSYLDLQSNTNHINDYMIVENKTFAEDVYEEVAIPYLDSIRVNLPLTLEEARNYYRNVRVFDFDQMEAGEERNMFFTFKTTPEMLKDTSAVISIRGIYVPEKGLDEHKVLDKEMEIVTSHDPNKMAVYDTRLNYRLVRFKRLKYKVKFQNDGEGPARLIKLNVDIPEMLDKSTLKVLDMYPKCRICPEEEVSYSCLDTIISKDQISFQFKNIYLPGTAQKGVYDRDSTKGFVKYSLKFGENFHKKKSKSRTAIIFDKNEPIITNTSTSRFSPGISIGLKSGYNSFPDLKDSKGYFLGATVSPYKSYKKYLQAELMIATQEFADFRTLSEPVGVLDLPDGTRVDSALRESEIIASSQLLNVDIVPISFRYNFNAVLAMGFGPQISFDVSNKVSTDSRTTYFTYLNNQIGKQIEGLSENLTSKSSDAFSDTRFHLFGDLTIGTSRIGPSVGLRYLYNMKDGSPQYHFYAIWKI